MSSRTFCLTILVLTLLFLFATPPILLFPSFFFIPNATSNVKNNFFCYYRIFLCLSVCINRNFSYSSFRDSRRFLEYSSIFFVLFFHNFFIFVFFCLKFNFIDFLSPQITVFKVVVCSSKTFQTKTFLNICNVRLSLFL